MTILSAKDVFVTFQKPGRAPAYAVRGVSLSVDAGEIVGILGESGSGKSTLAKVLAGASLKHATCSGTIRLQAARDWDCASSSKASLLRAGFRGVGFVSQHPSLVLNPFQRVRTQVTEFLAANGVDRRQRLERVLELLAAVCLKEPAKISARYPHQLSGGEKQRVAIAMALAASPQVLVCDEATASVDPATEQDLLSMFLSLRANRALAIVWITHNPSQLRGFADRVGVMYAGRIVESGSVDQVLDAPLHPYTAALMRCSKRSALLSEMAHRERLPSIPGGAPDAAAIFAGCSFAERCADRRESCDQAPSRGRGDRRRAGKSSACFMSSDSVLHASVPELRVSRLNHRYKSRSPIDRQTRPLALADVSFEIEKGRTLSIIGHTGSGKSTILRCIIGLEKPESGEILIGGIDTVQATPEERRALHRKVQVVFQDSVSALNPRLKVGDVIAEPLVIHRIGDKRSRAARAKELLEVVGLKADDVRGASARTERRPAPARRNRTCALDRAGTFAAR